MLLFYWVGAEFAGRWLFNHLDNNTGQKRVPMGLNSVTGSLQYFATGICGIL
jgi:hypothetical protein